MKKLFLFLFSLFTFHFSPCQQYGWSNITANLPKFSHDTVIINGGADTIIASISGLSFVDDNHGWISTNHPFEGEPSAVLETTDGGLTWTEHAAPLAAADIYMVDENTGYLGATNGMIYRTENGCQTWNYHGHLLSYLYDLGFPPRPAQNGYAGGKNGKMAEITPQGVFPFNLGLAGNVYCIDFPSVERGYAILDYQMIIYFMDNEWHVEANYPYAGKGWLHFYNDTLGWCVGDRFLKTEDGIDWYTTSASTLLEGTLTGVFFNDENNGWSVGAVGQIFYTGNGGLEWIKLEHSLTDGFLNGVRFTSPVNGFIYGGEKILLKYGLITGENGPGRPDDSEKPGMTVFPNPAEGSCRLQIANYNSQHAVVELMDAYGRSVRQVFAGLLPETGIVIGLEGLPAGVYCVRVRLDNRTLSAKLVKL